jgi:hypothetical protein
LVRSATGRGRNPSIVWHGLDFTERLSGLLVGRNYTIRAGVDTREVLVVTQATLKDTINVSGRGIVLASNTIEDVFAEICSIGTSGIACLEAEDSPSHEVVPFNYLLEVVGITGIRREGVREEETSEWVTTSISTMRVHLSSRIIGFHVDKLLLDEADDLDVSGGLHELNTGESAGWDHTSSAAGLGAPCNGFTFGITDN